MNRYRLCFPLLKGSQGEDRRSQRHVGEIRKSHTPVCVFVSGAAAAVQMPEGLGGGKQYVLSKTL